MSGFIIDHDKGNKKIVIRCPKSNGVVLFSCVNTIDSNWYARRQYYTHLFNHRKFCKLNLEGKHHLNSVLLVLAGVLL